MPTAIRSVKIDLPSEIKTEELANSLLKKLQPGDTIFLYGEMGVGKTTFVRYLINGFQTINKIQITEVLSPTFNIKNEYQINQIKINHLDLFRIKSIDETKNLGLFEDNSNSIQLVEWPQIIEEKPKNLIELFFEYEKDHSSRSVQIKGLNF